MLTRFANSSICRIRYFQQHPKKIGLKEIHINGQKASRKCLKDKQIKPSYDEIKNTVLCLAQVFLRQCQVYASQQLRQRFQHYFFYSRTWGEEVALRMFTRMFSTMKNSILIQTRSLLLSATCLLSYNWEDKNISNKALENAVEEYISVENLCSETVVCENCRKRQVIDQKVKGIEYCSCKGEATYTDLSRKYDSWQPFLERDNIIVWRKSHEQYPHLFCYKVYGSYQDMSSAAFLEVQLNTTCRTHWDSTALELSVLCSNKDTNSDLLYWIVKFPHFFSDRDYVYLRRFHIDEEKKEVVIVSRVVNDTDFPEGKGLYRVKEYWSKMVIKAEDDFHKPGMSYTLTYFDDPGMSLPSPVTSYVASTGFPRYLKQVYNRAMELQKLWEKGEDSYITLPNSLRYSREKLATTLSLVEESEEPTKLEESQAVMKEVAEPDVNQDNLLNSIKNFNQSSKNLDSEAKEAKIPICYKGIILDLLEAIEVISPDINDKDLLKLIDLLLKEKDNDKEDTSRKTLWPKIKSLRDKLAFAINKASKKEAHVSKSKATRPHDHYDLYSQDQEVLEMISKLFKAINEVIQADIDLRTGKGLLKQGTEAKKQGTEITTSSDSQAPTNNSYDENCACCACKHCFYLENFNSSWLPRSITGLIWTSSYPQDKSKKFEEECEKCSKEHKAQEDGSNATWWRYFTFSPSSKSGNKQDNHTNESDPEHVSNWPVTSKLESNFSSVDSQDDNFDAQVSSDAKLESGSWFWVPIQGSLEIIMWFSSLWLSHAI